MMTHHESGYFMDGNINPVAWGHLVGQVSHDNSFSGSSDVSRLLGDPRVAFNLTAGDFQAVVCHVHEERVSG